jgi:hypothetical protein
VNDFSTAQSLAERCLAIRRQLGDEVGVAAILLLMGGAELERGDFPRARALYAECLSTFARLDSRWWLSHILASFANLAAHQEQPLRAARLIGATMIGVETSRTRPIPLTNASVNGHGGRPTDGLAGIHWWPGVSPVVANKSPRSRVIA